MHCTYSVFWITIISVVGIAIKRLSSVLFFGVLCLIISMSGIYSCTRIFDSTDVKDTTKNPYNEEKMGIQGGPCFPDQSCNEGLYCQSDICLAPLHFGDGGIVVQEDGSFLDLDGLKAMGSLGDPCYPNYTCNVGFTCQNKLCVAPSDAGSVTDKFLDVLST